MMLASIPRNIWQPTGTVLLFIDKTFFGVK